MPGTLSTYITFFKLTDRKNINMPELFKLFTHFLTCYNVWKFNITRTVHRSITSSNNQQDAT